MFKRFYPILFSFVLCLISLLKIYAQAPFELFNWRVYSSMVNIISGSLDGSNKLWCATIGGVLSFDIQNNSFEIYNSRNGLYSIETKYISINPFTKEIYVGCYYGVLSIYNPKVGNWENYLEITNSQYSKKQINHILFQDNIAYICGDFGLTTFDTRQKVFLKTPSRLGFFPSGTSARHAVVFDNYLWIATELGVARIQLNKGISNPLNWENFVDTNGLNDPNIYFLGVDDNVLYAFALNKVYRFEQGSFKKVYNLESYETINSVQSYNGNIYFSTPFYVRDINYELLYFYTETPLTEKVNSFTIIDSNSIVLFLANGGVVIKNLKTNELQRHYPNSPISNQFRNFAIDNKGGFWSATNSDPTGEGIMYFYNGKWVNFTTQTYPEIQTNYYMKVLCVEDTAFCSSAGRGLLAIYPSGDTFKFKRYDQTNTLLNGIAGDPNWVIVQQTAYEESKEILWMVNYSVSNNGFLLVAKDRYNNFYGYLPMSNRRFHHLLIDSYGTKWISSIDGTGLYYFNERGTLEDSTDDIYDNLIKSTSLPSNQINTMALDQYGYIWCGTGTGIFLILNPNAVLNNSQPVVKKLKLLSDYSINCIFIDVLNYKWIATNNGVFIVSPDGSDILANITKDNSPLPSNEVLYINSNSETGDFYFGTSRGLAIATSMIVKPATSYEIKVSPQPFIIPKDELLLIEGLAMDSEIKILTIDGEIVRTLTTQSKKTFWDGKDYSGRYVQSGIYLIVAKSLTTRENSVYKVAVIYK